MITASKNSDLKRGYVGREHRKHSRDLYCGLISGLAESSLLHKTHVQYWIPKKVDLSEQSTSISSWMQQEYGIVDKVAPKSVVGTNSLDRALANGRWILALQEDWDDQGSLGYSISTWKRMETFLRNHARTLEVEYGIAFPAPQILPGPMGSIDVHWKTEKFELLLNIPSDPNAEASFYGDDRGNIHIKGTLDTSKANAGLLVWLMNFQGL
jgi:hypothetical protein